MHRRVRLRDRARYWFDNTMSRGIVSLIFWLAVATTALIVTVTAGLVLVGQPSTGDGSASPLELLWTTFVTTFSLAVPHTGGIAALALWFVLALGVAALLVRVPDRSAPAI